VQSEKNSRAGSTYGSERQQLPADVDGSIILVI